MTCFHLSIVVCLAAIAGCSGNSTNRLPSAAKSILQKADKIELISLDPGRPDKGESPPKGDYFGWKELGRTTIEDAETQSEIRSAVEKGLAEGGTPAKCFDPRHAIHAKYKGKTVDVLICFQCSQLVVYLDDKQQGSYRSFSRSSQSLLDNILTDANVPLAPKPEH